LPSAASAHVKWFAPYIVNAAPQPIEATLTNMWFWTGIALVLAFFLATITVERLPAGRHIIAVLDRVTGAVALRADDFMRAATAAFFVAIFAVGGVYLTPDLQTPSELVSWAQLAIAAGIFSRKTMPLSAVGIIALWVVALRDYDFFHLLDYLALGVGVAGYLVLASVEDRRWHERRFAVLFCGVAIALMWSSLEKFAYPSWFLPAGRGQAVSDLWHAARRVHPDGWRRRVHARVRADLEPASQTPLGHCAPRDLHHRGVPLRAHRPRRPRDDHGGPGPSSRRPVRKTQEAGPCSCSNAPQWTARRSACRADSGNCGRRSSYWGLHAAFYGAGYGTARSGR
jgi:hypothetical protein